MANARNGKRTPSATTATRLIKPATKPATKPAATTTTVPGSAATTMPPAFAAIMAIIAIARNVTIDTFNDAMAKLNARFPITPHASRNFGRFTGWRIGQFQNAVLFHNASWQLTDLQTLFLIRAEHPSGVGALYTGDLPRGVAVWRGVRNDYNRSGHGGPVPTVPAIEYGSTVFPRVPVVAVPATVPVEPATVPAKRSRKTA